VAEYKWPEQGKATVLGTEVERIDGLDKATGAAKYAYDINPDKMLLAEAVRRRERARRRQGRGHEERRRRDPLAGRPAGHRRR
jgi:hypothetical protein